MGHPARSTIWALVVHISLASRFVTGYNSFTISRSTKLEVSKSNEPPVPIPKTYIDKNTIQELRKRKNNELLRLNDEENEPSESVSTENKPGLYGGKSVVEPPEESLYKPIYSLESLNYYLRNPQKHILKSTPLEYDDNDAELLHQEVNSRRSFNEKNRRNNQDLLREILNNARSQEDVLQTSKVKYLPLALNLYGRSKRPKLRVNVFRQPSEPTSSSFPTSTTKTTPRPSENSKYRQPKNQYFLSELYHPISRDPAYKFGGVGKSNRVQNFGKIPTAVGEAASGNNPLSVHDEITIYDSGYNGKQNNKVIQSESSNNTDDSHEGVTATPLHEQPSSNEQMESSDEATTSQVDSDSREHGRSLTNVLPLAANNPKAILKSSDPSTHTIPLVENLLGSKDSITTTLPTSNMESKITNTESTTTTTITESYIKSTEATTEPLIDATTKRLAKPTSTVKVSITTDEYTEVVTFSPLVNRSFCSNLKSRSNSSANYSFLKKVCKKFEDILDNSEESDDSDEADDSESEESNDSDAEDSEEQNTTPALKKSETEDLSTEVEHQTTTEKRKNKAVTRTNIYDSVVPKGTHKDAHNSDEVKLKYSKTNDQIDRAPAFLSQTSYYPHHILNPLASKLKNNDQLNSDSVNKTHHHSFNDNEPECERGSKWINKCHRCVCLNSGFSECTIIHDCVLPPHGIPMLCKPYTTFDIGECNKCICSGDGVPICKFTDCYKIEQTEYQTPKRNKSKENEDMRNSILRLRSENGVDYNNRNDLLSHGHIFEDEESPSGSEYLREMKDPNVLLKKAKQRCAVGSVWEINCFNCFCGLNGMPRCDKVANCPLLAYGKPSRCRPNSVFHNRCGGICKCDDEGEPWCDDCPNL